MLVLAGATSLFVGTAFQAQMPEIAHHHGADEPDAHYSALFGANAAGRGDRRGAPGERPRAPGRPARRDRLRGDLGRVMALFALAPGYGAAVTLLVLAGVFNIAFTSMAQAVVQIQAPPALRGRVVGLFNASMLGLRAGSGFTVGLLGAWIGVEPALALSAGAVVAVAVGLLLADARVPAPPGRPAA